MHRMLSFAIRGFLWTGMLLSFVVSCDFIEPDFDPDQEVQERPTVFRLWGRVSVGTTESGQEVTIREYLDFSMGRTGMQSHFRAQGAQNETTVVAILYLIPGEKQGKPDEWDHHYRFDGGLEEGIIFNIERNAPTLRYRATHQHLILCPPLEESMEDDPSLCTQFSRAN